MKKLLLKIYYKILEINEKIIIQYNKRIVSRKSAPKVLDIDLTLKKIIEDKCSVSRYGDGEFGLMRGRSIIFQPYSNEIEKRLNEIIKSNTNNHIVCIPDVFSSIERFKDKPKKYWEKYLNLNRNKIYKLLDINNQYYDALVTRLYVDVKDKSMVETRFNKIKKIWRDREIVIVEGEKSRLGIGNDLFNFTKSIERIICPSIDAFSKYNEILKEVKKQDKSKLILIALGPTATVLAYDLSKDGYQAIDIGHIDIEYEWFLQGATEKCPVKNKYIGEIDGGTKVEKINNKRYESEIICSLL